MWKSESPCFLELMMIPGVRFRFPVRDAGTGCTFFSKVANRSLFLPVVLRMDGG